MTSFAYAQQSYSAQATSVRTTRDTEYAVFAKITNELKASAESGEFNRLVDAVQNNRQLWSILAVDVADKANELPKALRAQIFYLYEFTNTQSQKLLRREEGATVEPLLDINRSIMRGLRGIGAGV